MNKVTDLISSNADEIDENDEVSQGVNYTHDKSVKSHYLANMSNFAWEHTIFTIEKLLSIQTNALPGIRQLSTRTHN